MTQVLPVGTVLRDRYVIVELIGQGGMGAVYKAEDKRLRGRVCAVKEILPELIGAPGLEDQPHDQFYREASVLARLDHPNLPKVSDFFEQSEFLQWQGYDPSSINNLLNQLDLNTIMTTARTLIDQVSGIGGLVLVIALSIFFIVVDTLSMEYRSLLVERSHPHLHEALSGFEGRVRQYWLVSTIFGAIVAVLDWIALQALGIPLALAWALVSFITNYIPNIGFVLGVIPPALFGLLEGGWQLMLWVVVAYSLINFIMQSLIQPKKSLLCSALRLSPLSLSSTFSKPFQSVPQA